MNFTFLFGVAALLFANLPASAQFFVVKDSDGFVNVREKPATKSPVTDTLFNGQLVYYDAPAGNWMGIDYQKAEKEKSGFIYSNRTFPVDSFAAIPMTPISEKEVVLQKGNLKISVSKSAFEAGKHRFKYLKDGSNLVSKIDDKDYWGTDGELPRMQYKSITVSQNGKLLKLPAQALQNLYEPNLEYTKANWDAAAKTLYIQSMNSDGSGGYLVIWKIVNGVYRERFIVTGA